MIFHKNIEKIPIRDYFFFWIFGSIFIKSPSFILVFSKQSIFWKFYEHLGSALHGQYHFDL